MDIAGQILRVTEAPDVVVHAADRRIDILVPEARTDRERYAPFLLRLDWGYGFLPALSILSERGEERGIDLSLKDRLSLRRVVGQLRRRIRDHDVAQLRGTLRRLTSHEHSNDNILGD